MTLGTSSTAAKGANLAAGSVVAGHTPIGFVSPLPAVPLVKDGKLRALAVTGGLAIS